MTVATSMDGVSAFGDQPAHRHLLSDHLRRGQLLWARRCRHSCAHAQQVAWSIAGSRLRNTGSTPRRLAHLPAVPKKPDFDNRHGDRLRSSPIESTCSLEHVRSQITATLRPRAPTNIRARSFSEPDRIPTNASCGYCQRVFQQSGLPETARSQNAPSRLLRSVSVRS